MAGKTLLYLSVAPTDCPSSYETTLPSLTFRSLKLKPHPVCHLTINHKLKGSACSPVYMAVTVLCTRFRSKTAPHNLIQAKVSNLLRSVYDVCFVKDLGQTRKVLLILQVRPKRRVFLAWCNCNCTTNCGRIHSSLLLLIFKFRLIKSRIGVRAFTFKTSALSLDLRDATFKIRVKALFFDKGFDQGPSLPSW